MTELQIILLVCAVVFVGALYWWGKKNNAQQMQRPFSHESHVDEAREDEFEVVPVSKPSMPVTAVKIPEIVNEPVEPLVTQEAVAPMSHHDEDALVSRMDHVESAANTEIVPEVSESASQQVATQSQIFALLILSPSRELSRKHIHASMEASRLSFHQDGTYVHRDTTGNIVFRVANVVEPGFFPNLDDETFATPGIALVLELPSTITPYRAMDEFITVARKVSQNLGGKLYDAQRHLIKESDLKAMREYAQSLTY